MRTFIIKTNLAFFNNAIVLLLLLVTLTACKKDDNGKLGQEEPSFDTEEYSIPTNDALTVVSDLPAYIFPYEHKDFGAALVNRLQNKVTEINDETIMDLASVVLHSSQMMDIINELPLIIEQLLLGHNIIILEPTIKAFSDFCDIITATYITLQSTEEGQELLAEIDIVPGARQTLEAFYNMSKNPSELESMFLFDTDSNGIFAEAIAVRGSDFHIVNRMKDIDESEVTHEQVIDEEGTTEQIEAPKVESSADTTTSNTITPYTYGLFADMFTEWINDQEYYIDTVEDMRARAVNTFNTRAAETTKLSLEEIGSVQKVQYTINAGTPYGVGQSTLPVTVSFEICSIYMEHDDCDYYCVYKNILSYNQMLDCGPTGDGNKRKWRKSENFGVEIEHHASNIYVERKWEAYPYYGPFMRDLEGKSICHANTGNFVNSTTQIVSIPQAQSIENIANVAVEKYSPKNSIGSVDHTSGFSYGFDGGLFLAKEPGVNVGFSVSYDSSTTQTIDDLEIVASSTGGIPTWKYIGHNLPDAYFNLVKEPSHSDAPSIMRRECEVDQSWIWRVPTPTGSYRLFDETSVTTSIMYYEIGFFKAYNNFTNHTTTKRVSFLMMPPPRCEQSWMMNVAPYSDELNSMLATTHNRFWNKENHEFKLADSSTKSRISIEQFLNDFERDLHSKRLSWKNRNFTGRYTFTYYNIDDEDNKTLSFDFIVE